MSKPSEIFESYAKIALEKGIIKKAEETNPRFDSRSVKEIANLYNVKNDKPSDMEYKKNIIEDAHPEPVVFFRSHDKINSLVENENERQNIIINILRKMPNGNLTQKKYARELALSLIRVATDMDNQDKEELRVLADACAEQIQKIAFDFKDIFNERSEDATDVAGGALSGTVLGGIAGGLIGAFGGPVGIAAGATAGAALGTTLAAIFKTSPQAKNLIINAQIAKKELADIIQERSSDPFLHQLDAALTHIIITAGNYSSLVDKMHDPKSSSADKDNVKSIASSYLTEISNLKVLIGTFKMNADSGKYAPDESDWLSKLKTPFKAMVGDDVGDEEKALETLSRVIKTTEEGIIDAMNEAQGLHSVIAAPTTQPVSSKVYRT